MNTINTQTPRFETIEQNWAYRDIGVKLREEAWVPLESPATKQDDD